MNLTLPIDSKERKKYSLSRGCYAYFPAALAGVARHSYEAGAKHTYGELVHNRWLSNDHEDCIERHMTDLRDMLASVPRGISCEPDDFQSALLTEANALAWRALALSQEMHERFGGAPLAPAARLGDGTPLTATGNAAAEKAARATLDRVNALTQPPVACTSHCAAACDDCTRRGLMCPNCFNVAAQSAG